MQKDKVCFRVCFYCFLFLKLTLTVWVFCCLCPLKLTQFEREISKFLLLSGRVSDWIHYHKPESVPLGKLWLVKHGELIFNAHKALAGKTWSIVF